MDPAGRDLAARRVLVAVVPVVQPYSFEVAGGLAGREGSAVVLVVPVRTLEVAALEVFQVREVGV